jgi:hypothetical protein
MTAKVLDSLAGLTESDLAAKREASSHGLIAGFASGRVCRKAPAFNGVS